MKKDSEFYRQYTTARQKIKLKLWDAEYAKGYLYCYLENVLEVNDSEYDEYSNLIDDMVNESAVGSCTMNER